MNIYRSSDLVFNFSIFYSIESLENFNFVDKKSTQGVTDLLSFEH